MCIRYLQLALWAIGELQDQRCTSTFLEQACTDIILTCYQGCELGCGQLVAGMPFWLHSCYDSCKTVRWQPSVQLCPGSLLGSCRGRE